jgi:hypothetical protein
MKKRWLILILAVGFIAVLAMYYFFLRNPDSDPDYTGKYKKQAESPSR